MRRSIRALSSLKQASSAPFAAALEQPTSTLGGVPPPAPQALRAPPPPRTVVTPTMSDGAILSLLHSGALSAHVLEAQLGDPMRAVHLRRQHLAGALAGGAAAAAAAGAGAPQASPPTPPPASPVAGIPYTAASFDADAFYRTVLNTNCEAVIGFIPYPLGVVGPLPIDGVPYRIPLATTEGALVASTNRGCTALRASGGVIAEVLEDGMTRAPLVAMPCLRTARAVKDWCAAPANFAALQRAFGSTTRFGSLSRLDCTLAGRLLYLRFKCATGDAMGMNMITKGVSECLNVLRAAFPAMRVMALSGNMCTDKKPSAINWVQGRGKTVVVEARLPADVLRSVLKTTAAKMAELNTAKNLIGSALAGSIGGNNAHASNLVTAVFLATGQDPAQNVESSNCLMQMEALEDGALLVSATMPSLEVGTVGGGTGLPAQGACLDMLGCRGAHRTSPGDNARQLAKVVAATVLAGEISLMAALCTNDLLGSHLKLNRKADKGPLEWSVQAGSSAAGAGASSSSSSSSSAAGGASSSGAAGRPAPVHYISPGHKGSLHGLGSGPSAHHHHGLRGAASFDASLHLHPLTVLHTGDEYLAQAQGRHHQAGRRYFETASADLLVEEEAGEDEALAYRRYGFAASVADKEGEEEPRLSVP